MSHIHSNIPVIIRSHVNTAERLKLLKTCLQSYKEHKLHKLGPLYVIDDQGSLGEEVKELVMRQKGTDVTYIHTEGKPSTLNGVLYSLKCQDTFPALLCCDDIVFATGSREKIEKIVEKEIPRLNNFGAIQMFMPHTVGHLFRTPHTLVPETKLHAIETADWRFHAWVMNLWSAGLAKAYIQQYETIQKEYTNPPIQDDHCARIVAQRNVLGIYATTTCFAWHTGSKHRALHDPLKLQGAAEYQAHKFNGSNEDKMGY